MPASLPGGWRRAVGALLADSIDVEPDEKVCAVLFGGNWDLRDLAEIYKSAE